MLVFKIRLGLKLKPPYNEWCLVLTVSRPHFPFLVLKFITFFSSGGISECIKAKNILRGVYPQARHKLYHYCTRGKSFEVHYQNSCCEFLFKEMNIVEIRWSFCLPSTWPKSAQKTYIVVLPSRRTAQLELIGLFNTMVTGHVINFL